jgi:hypothetical protein
MNELPYVQSVFVYLRSRCVEPRSLVSAPDKRTRKEQDSFSLYQNTHSTKNENLEHPSLFYSREYSDVLRCL